MFKIDVSTIVDNPLNGYCVLKQKKEKKKKKTLVSVKQHNIEEIQEIWDLLWKFGKDIGKQIEPKPVGETLMQLICVTATEKNLAISSCPDNIKNTRV